MGRDVIGSAPRRGTDEGLVAVAVGLGLGLVGLCFIGITVVPPHHPDGVGQSAPVRSDHGRRRTEHLHLPRDRHGRPALLTAEYDQFVIPVQTVPGHLTLDQCDYIGLVRGVDDPAVEGILRPTASVVDHGSLFRCLLLLLLRAAALGGLDLLSFCPMTLREPPPQTPDGPSVPARHPHDQHPQTSVPDRRHVLPPLEPYHPLLHECGVDRPQRILVPGVMTEEELGTGGQIFPQPRNDGEAVVDEMSVVPREPHEVGDVIALEVKMPLPLVTLVAMLGFGFGFGVVRGGGGKVHDLLGGRDEAAPVILRAHHGPRSVPRVPRGMRRHHFPLVVQGEVAKGKVSARGPFPAAPFQRNVARQSPLIILALGIGVAFETIQREERVVGVLIPSHEPALIIEITRMMGREGIVQLREGGARQIVVGVVPSVALHLLSGASAPVGGPSVLHDADPDEAVPSPSPLLLLPALPLSIREGLLEARRGVVFVRRQCIFDPGGLPEAPRVADADADAPAGPVGPPPVHFSPYQIGARGAVERVALLVVVLPPDGTVLGRRVPSPPGNPLQGLGPHLLPGPHAFHVLAQNLPRPGRLKQEVHAQNHGEEDETGQRLGRRRRATVPSHGES
mmetsp:Transcript_43545/g.132521  ORF Transcript_43545/g.132521 Transcript_43545/m.132521 type:complete len:621 (+) Transcript_43545:234-2096(+)